jgi:hypothetical protein
VRKTKAIRVHTGKANQALWSQFELVGDPVVSDTVVFFDAVEQKSGQLRRVRIPLTIVHMAAQQIEVSSAV